MVRSSVDLPEPDGPRITVTSPARTARSMPLSTSSGPKLLWTDLMSTMTVMV